MLAHWCHPTYAPKATLKIVHTHTSGYISGSSEGGGLSYTLAEELQHVSLIVILDESPLSLDYASFDRMSEI